MAAAMAHAAFANVGRLAGVGRRFRVAGVMASGASGFHLVSTRRQVLTVLGSAPVAIMASSAFATAAADDFIVTPSGLAYKETVVGSGPEAISGKKIKAHYAGRLESNGVKFDSSYDRGSPLVFTVGVGQVIKGWDLGIAGGAGGPPPMKAGGKRVLRIPAALGYGDRGAGGVIPGGATLIFDVEYLGLA